MAVIEASKNKLIQEMLHLITEPTLEGLKRSRSHSMLMPKKPEEVLREHAEIVRAIVDKDGQRARKLMIDHLDNVIKRSYLMG